MSSVPGMFLWVRLILITLEDADSVRDLHEAVDLLPKQLGEIYDQIIRKLKEKMSERDFQKVVRALSWIAFAKRSLKSYELEYGAIICPANDTVSHETKPLGNFLELCKPLVEEQSNQMINFVHFSVKEYANLIQFHGILCNNSG